MEQKETTHVLAELILEKEAQHRVAGKELKMHFNLTYESLKPINIIRNTFKDVVSAPHMKTHALNAAIGFASGILTKKLLVGKTQNPIKKLAGILIEIGVSNIVAKNADAVRSVAGIILKKINEHSNPLKTE